MATIVIGEASESDEEVEEPTYNESMGRPGPSPTGSISSRGSSILAKSTSEVDATSDLLASEPPPTPKPVINSKYKSPFQKRLVEEMFALRGQAETIAHKSYNDSTKQIKQLIRNAEHLTNDLKRSAYQLQLLTNDLFRLEDTIDYVNQNKPFSKLVIPSKYVREPDVEVSGAESK